MSDGFACKNHIKNSPCRGLSRTGKPFMFMDATYVYVWLGGYVSVESVQRKNVCNKYYYSLQVVLLVTVTVLFSLHNGEFI